MAYLGDRLDEEETDARRAMDELVPAAYPYGAARIVLESAR